MTSLKDLSVIREEMQVRVHLIQKSISISPEGHAVVGGPAQDEAQH